jgi:hypothetical protein
MSGYELAGHVAFALIAISYLVKDILWLRILSVVASVAGIAYNYVVPWPPLWIVIYWNIFFLAINITQIFLTLRERRGVAFSEEEAELYGTIFSGFAPFEFMKLLRLGEWKTSAPGTVLANQDEELEEVILLYNGAAEVVVNGQKVAQVRGGNLVGEMSFFTGGRATATVTICETSRYLSWKKDDLRKLFYRNPSMRPAMQAVISADLARKLMPQPNTQPDF